ncbi:hypothetical protein NFI96_023493 [Prochilodus magdalenae]|nr:hypothetical protein NFI96_023493 [Prochilodus magdalenae]
MGFLPGDLQDISRQIKAPGEQGDGRQTARYSALLVGIIYGKKRYDYLKPIAEEERRIEEEEKKVREEKERIAKQLAEGESSFSRDTGLGFFSTSTSWDWIEHVLDKVLDVDRSVFRHSHIKEVVSTALMRLSIQFLPTSFPRVAREFVQEGGKGEQRLFRLGSFSRAPCISQSGNILRLCPSNPPP